MGTSVGQKLRRNLILSSLFAGSASSAHYVCMCVCVCVEESSACVESGERGRERERRRAAGERCQVTALRSRSALILALCFARLVSMRGTMWTASPFDALRWTLRRRATNKGGSGEVKRGEARHWQRQKRNRGNQRKERKERERQESGRMRACTSQSSVPYLKCRPKDQSRETRSKLPQALPQRSAHGRFLRQRARAGDDTANAVQSLCTISTVRSSM